MPRHGLPDDVRVLRKGLEDCLTATDEQGRVVGNATYGVYAFYDYDSEPIYVGQTREKLRTRIRRHLTNQRTDAVAMNVLDPFEVAEIEMWPLFDLEGKSHEESKDVLNMAEYLVFQKLLQESAFGAVLNEKPPAQPLNPIPFDLPPSCRMLIVPCEVYQSRKHPDIRIARRATTIANLARVISERSVSPGLRHTLLVQAQRLERLARERLEDVQGAGCEDESLGEGEEDTDE